MRHLSISLLFLVACGGGSETPVVDLSNSSQINLCENFLDDICAQPEFADFCDDPCINTACIPAVENGDVDLECGIAPDGGPITAEMVEDCGITGDPGVCLAGGGCMFDALEAACSGG
jgi:hypothetical protein